MEPQNCIFCKIAKKEIPSKTIYEDTNHLAFLDISPFTKGHILLIPKMHYETFLDLPEAEVKELFALAQKLGKKLKSALEAQHIFLLVMGEEVPHTHVHLIPYYGKMPFVRSSGPEKETIEDAFKRIKDYKEGGNKLSYKS